MLQRVNSETQFCYAVIQSFPQLSKAGMPCNCTMGNKNSGGQARRLHPGGITDPNSFRASGLS
jgi:hypothetical protein